MTLSLLGDPADTPNMVWLFERDEQAIRVETSYDRTSAEFLLIRNQQDGSQLVERFKDEGTFRTRLEELERQLDSDQWRRSGPFLLRDGWKL